MSTVLPGTSPAAGLRRGWIDRLRMHRLRDPALAKDLATLGYVARAVLAMGIALYAAAWLQLGSPLSALTTVLIVINPVLGALVSKSVWRIAGTLFGALVAVGAMAAFGQSPLLFFGVMSLWVGVCCAASTVLRYFRAYGAVLSGYTLVIVAAPTYANPETIFLSALSRLSVVGLGIAAATAVFLLTTRRPRPPAVLARVGGLVAAAAGLVAQATRAPAGPPNDPWTRRDTRNAAQLSMAAAVMGVDEAIEFLPSNDPAIGRAVVALRLATARLLGTLSGIGLLERVTARVAAYERLASTQPDEAERFVVTGAAAAALATLRATLDEVAAGFAPGAPEPALQAVARLLPRLRAAREALAALESLPPETLADDAPSLPATPASADAAASQLLDPPQQAAGAHGSDWRFPQTLRRLTALRALAFIDHAGLFLDRFEDVLRAMQRVEAQHDRRPAHDTDTPEAVAPLARDLPRLRNFHDWQTAIRNGVRGTLTTLLCCLIWYVTQWPSAPTMLAFVAPATSLLSTAPSASRASTRFAGGTALAVVIAVPAALALLPQANNSFALVFGTLCLVLVPALWFQWHPRHGLLATGYLVFMAALLGVQNPVRFDDAAMLNTFMAYLLGAGGVILVFRVLLPADDVREVRRLSARLVRNVQRLAAEDARGATAWWRPFAALRRLAAGPRRGFSEGAIWEHLHMQVVTRLLQRAQVLPPALREEVVDAAMTTVMLGRAILRLRDAGAATGPAALPPEARAAIGTTFTALARLSRHPDAAAQTALAAAASVPQELAAVTEDDALSRGAADAAGDLRSRHRLAATLQQIGELILFYPRFFDRDGPLQRFFMTPATLRLGVLLPPVPQETGRAEARA